MQIIDFFILWEVLDFLRSEFQSEKVMVRQSSPFKLYFFIVLMHTVTCLQSFKSMMALFQTPCPQGWTQLSFNSEYIRIAGTKPLLQRGGQSNVTLTVDNLPPHTHSYKTIPLPGDSGWSHITSGLARHNTFQKQLQTGSTGNGVPFNIQPPFITFNLCQLNEDLTVTVTNQNYNCDACYNASLNSLVKDNSISIVQLQGKTDNLTTNFAGLQGIVNANGETLKSSNSSIAQLQGKTDTLSISLTGLQGSVNANTQGLKSLNMQQQAKTQSLATSISSLQAKVNVNSQSLQSTNSDIVQLEARISNLQTFFNIPPPAKKTTTSSTSTNNNQNLIIWVILSLALSLVAVVVAVSLPFCFRCCECCNKRGSSYVTNDSARQCQ